MKVLRTSNVHMNLDRLSQFICNNKSFSNVNSLYLANAGKHKNSTIIENAHQRISALIVTPDSQPHPRTVGGRAILNRIPFLNQQSLFRQHNDIHM